MKKILIVSPHCDDAELGCGGYIARSVYEGNEVFVWIVSSGDVFFSHLDRIVTSEERLEETKASLEILGAKIYGIGFPGKDTLLDSLPRAHGIQILDNVIQEYGPDEVLIPLPSFHQDHLWTHEICIAATRPTAAIRQPNLIAAYEYPLQKWGNGSCADPANGGIYIDISQYIDIKISALSCYKSQMRGSNNSLSLQSVRALAKTRGYESNFTYAELFHTLRRRVPDVS
ncbi:MAG TPA: PIG-L family deacetylase [Legionella sp.]|nr:PIG-L family deacetylase [Legionella sp.]